MVIGFLPFVKKIPDNINRLDEVLWKEEKARILIRSLGVLPILLGAFYLNTNLEAKFFVITTLFSYLTYGIIVIYIRKNISYLKDETLTGLGSAMYYISNFTLAYFYIAKYLIPKSPSWVYFVLILIMLVYYLFKSQQKRLNTVQETLINTIEPKILLHELKPDWKKFKDRVKAMKLLKDLNRNKRYGVRKALVEELTKNESNKSDSLKGFIIAFILFLITSIGEGLAQDMFNDDIKKALCDWVGIYCN